MRYQTLFKEYVWLVNLIARRGRISFEEINRLWVDTEMSDGITLSRSTFNRHKDAIEDIFGIYIECDRHDGYKYYIENSDVLERDTIQNWMLSTMSVNNLLAEHKSVHNRVILESVPSSDDFLSVFLEAMKRNVKVKIFYKKYSDELGRERIISPLCVKLHLRRWYVLSMIEGDELRCFSLDRIHEATITDDTFEIPAGFDAESYFADYVGVMIDDSKKKERIVIRAFGREGYYLRDLPLHSSQRELVATDDYVDFEYKLVPTNDFVQQLMSRGGLERVLEPKWLAERMICKFEYASKLYSDVDNKENE